MMGTDIRIKRDPLAMKLREDQIKESKIKKNIKIIFFSLFLSFQNICYFAVWGGDPVYPTVNYIQDPNEVTDYRGADFHEPTPNMLSFLLEVSLNGISEIPFSKTLPFEIDESKISFLLRSVFSAWTHDIKE